MDTGQHGTHGGHVAITVDKVYRQEQEPVRSQGGDDCSGLAIEAVSCTGTECPRKS